MAKSEKTVFFCKECGYESGRWLGQCPGCGVVGAFVEGLRDNGQKNRNSSVRSGEKPVSITSVALDENKRLTTGFVELDRVLGGGIVQGELILMGGDPGIGKSTLLLQVCKNVSDLGKKVLYVSGEESLSQIKIRADRMGTFSDSLSLLAETEIEVIENTVHEFSPDLVIIDSIQTMYRDDVDSAPGSVSQVRESTNALLQLAKGESVPIFIVGHVTKEGVVAGPRMLEHMVDTVLYFEGDKYASYRILRSVKNRFGSTNEVGVFEMTGKGLSQVQNPSEFMLKGRPKGAPGSVVSCMMEGTRPILVEIQALLNRTGFGTPRRTAVGIDYNRVNLLMAVMEKRLGTQIGDYDAYVNIAGGMKVSEPAIDLALVLAMLSSFKNIAVPSDVIVFGEVGLSGEIRAVPNVTQRVKEAGKLGFSRCILPKVCVKSLEKSSKKMSEESSQIRLFGVLSIGEASEVLSQF